MGRGLIYRQIRNPALFALVLLMRATPWFGFVIQVPGHPVSIAELAERYPAPPAPTMLGAGFWWLTGLTTLAAGDAVWRLLPLRSRREKGVLF